MIRIFHILSQSIIFVSGIGSAFLTQVPDDELNRYACIVALISAPLWLYETYKGKQWGMFWVCMGYNFVWLYGLYINWF
jgi:hypothetical protein